ncbi:hypothetical protein A9Q88_11980 [Gammaproteobacteria bacterium 50_400_T64]|nr:hypothetical protein A9Q88_11980 [Gammaproteobacteria bacterium 50_400_T64]
MKNHDLSHDKNPDHALFRVAHLGNPEGTPLQVRLEPTPYGETNTEDEALLAAIKVVSRSLELPSRSEMRAALKYIQPPPVLKKDGSNYKAQHALQRLACGELASITAAVSKPMARYTSALLVKHDDPPGSYTLPFTQASLLAVFRELLSAGWGFPSPGETDFKGWQRTFVPPSGGWGEDGRGVSDDH